MLQALNSWTFINLKFDIFCNISVCMEFPGQHIHKLNYSHIVMYKCMLISDHLLHLTITLMLLSCSPNFPHTQYLDIYTLMHALIILLVHASVYIQQLFFEIEVNSDWIFTELRKWWGKYSNNHYSLRLKRIIVLVYTHEVISTKSERKPLKSTIWLTD